MNIDISSQKNTIMIVVGVLILLGGGYYFFPSIETGTTTGSTISSDLLSTNINTFLTAKNSIDLKDISFLKSEFYPGLEDYSEHILITPATGRDNPFIPYVAPGSIR
jgi:hypothetical protein